jgi:5-formyltetrahydrofolate cyclo-ligase
MTSGTKAAIRAEVRARVRAIPAAMHAAGSRRVAEAIRKLPEWQSAKSVLLFVPLTDEPDLLGLLRESVQSGRVTALPAFDTAAGVYQARQITDLAADLVPGAFNVPEPAPHCQVVPVAALDFAVVPGIAFTSGGGRLGRGRGFYDRLLAATRAVTCGVGFDEQLIPEMPVEPHDVKLHYVVTPSRVHDCRAESD